MIFNVPGHIDMIRQGLRMHPQFAPPQFIVKTQTRRLNRGMYQIGKDYAVQRKQGAKAEPDIRIVMDTIWKEDVFGISGGISVGDVHDLYLSKEDAWAEGGYTPEEFEMLFNELNPKRDWIRWAFKFHVIEVENER